MIWLAAPAAVLVLAWIAALAVFRRAAKRIPVLEPGDRGGGTVTVVVAAKDEEEGVERCVRSVLAQDAPLDLIVVDDRSTDGTPGILKRLSEEFAGRMQVVTITRLPEDWGGQNHALSTGARAAKGEWLLFTDADCRLLSPAAVSTALREAASIDLFSILPRLEMPTIWERAHVPLCSAVLLAGLRLGEANRPESNAAYANGAFLLVRRAAYEQIGGHERVRSEINDDVALARLAKWSGLRTRVAANRGLLSTRMYGTLPEAWRGWTRNFAGTMRRPGKLLAAAVATFTLGVMPWVGFAACASAAAADHSFAPAALAWGIAVVASHAGAAILTEALGGGVAASLLHPLGAAFVSAALLRAAGRTLTRRPTVWEGARYVTEARAPGAP